MATFLRRTSDYCSLCDRARFKAPLLSDQEKARMNRRLKCGCVFMFMVFLGFFTALESESRFVYV